ncbi:MAG: molybdopterin-guanine dinucleotide biosynthesis protein B [Hyphomicrobiales bacterium]
MSAPVFGVAGYKNSGKTTLVERLVRDLSERGVKVSTLKHAHHNFEIDHAGRDSHRHRAAGAREVAIVSRSRWAVIHELHGSDEPDMEQMLAKFAPCDLVIIEGYRSGPQPKIEIRDVTLDHPVIAGDDNLVVAIAANGPVSETNLPVFDRDDIDGIANFIISHCGVRT